MAWQTICAFDRLLIKNRKFRFQPKPILSDSCCHLTCFHLECHNFLLTFKESCFLWITSFIFSVKQVFLKWFYNNDEIEYFCDSENLFSDEEARSNGGGYLRSKLRLNFRSNSHVHSFITKGGRQTKKVEEIQAIF